MYLYVYMYVHFLNLTYVYIYIPWSVIVFIQKSFWSTHLYVFSQRYVSSKCTINRRFRTSPVVQKVQRKINSAPDTPKGQNPQSKRLLGFKHVWKDYGEEIKWKPSLRPTSRARNLCEKIMKLSWIENPFAQLEKDSTPLKKRAV